MTDAPLWYQSVEGMSIEEVGVLQNKGWDKLTPDKAAAQAVKAYREAEKHIGIPADQIIRMPKDPATDTAGMRAIWERLGAPKEAKDYDFSSVKNAKGEAVYDEATTEFLRQTAHTLNLPKDAATRFAAEWYKHNDAKQTAALAEFTAKIAEEKTTLAKNWGANAAANDHVAKNAAAALGVKPEDVTALESVIGYARIMELFRTIGEKIGEDKFVRTEDTKGIMTLEQAMAKMSDLKADTAWAGRYMAGGAAEKREMGALVAIIAAAKE